MIIKLLSCYSKRVYLSFVKGFYHKLPAKPSASNIKHLSLGGMWREYPNYEILFNNKVKSPKISRKQEIKINFFKN